MSVFKVREENKVFPLHQLAVAPGRIAGVVLQARLHTRLTW